MFAVSTLGYEWKPFLPIFTVTLISLLNSFYYNDYHTNVSILFISDFSTEVHHMLVQRKHTRVVTLSYHGLNFSLATRLYVTRCLALSIVL